MDIEKIRHEFPLTKIVTYLDNCSTSIPPISAVSAVRQFLEEISIQPRRTDQFYVWQENLNLAIREAAILIGAKEHEIALIKNTTEGLNTIANVIKWKPTDNVVLNNLEFPTLILPWWQKHRSLGVGLRWVEHQEGKLSPAQFTRKIDNNTRVVALSSVEWTNGFKNDIKTISSLIDRSRTFLVVDAIQQLGALRMNVKEENIDFLVCGGHKWLMSPFGCGFLYCREELIDQLQPLYLGWTNMLMYREKAYYSPAFNPIQDYRLIDTARKFEVGGFFNFVGAIGLMSSLQYINNLGIENIEARIFQLTDKLIKGLQDLGYRVTSPLETESRSGIVSFQGDETILAALEEEGIRVSVRYSAGAGGIRIAPHFFNHEDDIYKVLEVLRRIKANN